MPIFECARKAVSFLQPIYFENSSFQITNDTDGFGVAFHHAIRLSFVVFRDFPNFTEFLEALENLEDTRMIKQNEDLFNRVAKLRYAKRTSADACLPLFLSKAIRKAFEEQGDFDKDQMQIVETVARTVFTIVAKVAYISADECLERIVHQPQDIEW